MDRESLNSFPGFELPVGGSASWGTLTCRIFKLNYDVHKVEKALRNFPHSDWLVKIMTS